MEEVFGRAGIDAGGNALKEKGAKEEGRKGLGDVLCWRRSVEREVGVGKQEGRCLVGDEIGVFLAPGRRSYLIISFLSGDQARTRRRRYNEYGGRLF